MERTTLDLWVGVFVAAGIGALLFLALKVGNLAGFEAGQTYAVTAAFENIGGLKPRAPVKSAGVVVGRVGGVSFDGNAYEAVATLDLDTRYAFPDDSNVAIMTSGLLGEQYVAIEAGGSDKMLKSGDRIRLTQGAVVLENLIGQFLFNKSAEEGAAAKGE